MNMRSEGHKGKEGGEEESDKSSPGVRHPARVVEQNTNGASLTDDQASPEL